MSKASHRIRIVAVMFTAVALSACGDDDTEANDANTEANDANTATVTVEGFDFQPDPLDVPAGTTISFVNEDAINHTVTAGTRGEPTPEVFDGQLAEQGATFELTLDKAGTYPYFCEVHLGPGMTATITVE